MQRAPLLSAYTKMIEFLALVKQVRLAFKEVFLILTKTNENIESWKNESKAATFEGIKTDEFLGYYLYTSGSS